MTASLRLASRVSSPRIASVKLTLAPAAAGERNLTTYGSPAPSPSVTCAGSASRPAGLLGIFQADQVNAAGVPGHIHVDGCRVHAADVQEARRAGRETSD